MKEHNTLDIGEVASLLFFTRAAVEADPALASSTLKSPFLHEICRVWFQQPGNATPPLTIANIYRLWDSGAASRPCRRCGTRMLLLGGNGGCGGASFFGFVDYYCPFCREKLERKRISLSTFHELQDKIVDLVKNHPASGPGLPTGSALAKLGELRAADLADPGHPLEAASLKAAGVSPPVLTGHPDDAVSRAQAFLVVSTPTILKSIKMRKAQVEASHADRVAKVDAKLAPLRGAPGKPSPKFLFKTGELSMEEYRNILQMRRKLNAEISPEKLRQEIEESVVSETRKQLDGRLLTDLEQEALLSVLKGLSSGYPALLEFLL